MLTFTPKKGAACAVQVDAETCTIFPAETPKDGWVFLSHPEEALTDKRIVSWPGEYDVAGMAIRAVGQEQGRQVSYSCAMDGIKVAFVDTPVLPWNDVDLEKMGDIDILVVAADDPKKVLPLVEAVDPRVVILTSVKGGDLPGVAKACGLASVQAVPEYKVKQGGLPQDSRQVVVLG